VVIAVRMDVLTAEEACARWQLSPEELAEWERAWEAAGMRGLHVTMGPRGHWRRRRPRKRDGNHAASQQQGRCSSDANSAPVIAENGSTRSTGSGERVSYLR